MIWYKGMPPKTLNGSYLLYFKKGIVCSGRYRYGMYGEPFLEKIAWRCDCCGTFGTPTHWEYIEPPYSEEAREVRDDGAATTGTDLGVGRESKNP